MATVLSLRLHVESQKHRSNMSKPTHPMAKFVKMDPKETLALEPGEPVPPGLEEVIIKNCAIQPLLDTYKTPLIGLEYFVELTSPNTYDDECYYYCLLCEKTGGDRNMLIHLTSIYHNLKYLSRYFPTVAKKLQALPNRKMKKAFGLVVTEVVGDIEAKMGRMKPFMESRSDFDVPGRMFELQKMVNIGPHLRETEGAYFDEKATSENLQKKSEEFLNAPPVTSKSEDIDKVNDSKEATDSLFNKTKSISVDKKQLRPREDNSPDVEIVDVELPGKSSEKNKRTRSLSSVSTLSSSSSTSRSRHRRRKLQRWSRSRSRSASRYRRRSPYSRRYSRGSRSRDRSPYRRRFYHSPGDRGRERLDRYGRSRDMYDSRNEKYRRDRSYEDRNSVLTAKEKERWDSFRAELKKIESVKLEKLKYFEKNPEKHPQYPEEWKSFWNRRYNELQRSGIDPSKHDFKPEWISFWTKRMKELYEEDLHQSKENLRKQFELPEDPGRDYPLKNRPRRRNNGSPGLVDVSPPTPDRKDVIADIKTTWKAFTGSDIRDVPRRELSPWEDDRSSPVKKEPRSPSPNTVTFKLLEEMPQRKTRTSSLIFVLRKLTVLEEQLGYLAPKVFELMQQALALEKIKEEESLELLVDPENAFYLETVREKLIGLLCAGLVPRNMVNTARSAMKHIDIALFLVSKRKRTLPESRPTMVQFGSVPLAPVPPPQLDPVVVPGVGQVDKVAIAQQIATALIEQGKTNVTEAELGQLINAVVGMAEASMNSAQPLTTANFLQQLQEAQRSNEQTLNLELSTQTAPEVSSSHAVIPSTDKSSTYGALKMLQSAYNEAKTESPTTEIVDLASPKPSTSISDNDLVSTLSAFNNLSNEEQVNFVRRLKTTNPDMLKMLSPFIPAEFMAEPVHSKRSPITISLSKAKSEPKIRPISSGRLSPFSSRSGGANPTVGEGSDDDVTLVTDSSVNALHSNNTQNILPSKSINVDPHDDYDDEDDDDYSYEDVYKAAQAKLRQEQFVEKAKSEEPNRVNNASATKSESKSPNDGKPKIIEEKIGKAEIQVSTAPSEVNLPQNLYLGGERQNKELQLDNRYSGDNYREMPSRDTHATDYQSNPYDSYKLNLQNAGEPQNNYHSRQEYSENYDYSYQNNQTSDNNWQTSEASSDPYYNDQSRGYYGGPRDNSYNGDINPNQYGFNQPNTRYGNNVPLSHGSSINRPQIPYPRSNYAPWRPPNNDPYQRFPDSNYPPY